MKTAIKATALLLLAMFVSFSANSQDQAPGNGIANRLPEYVVIIITAENTGLFGGIGITINGRKSEYQESLEELEFLLRNKNEFRIRNQTDLLNAMSYLGFAYLDAFNASAESTGSGIENDASSTYRVNMVFRKKEID